MVFLIKWQRELRLLRDAQPEVSSQSGPFLSNGVKQVRWLRSPSIKQTADFLLYLFQEKNLQPSTIDYYRTAIADKIGNDSLNISKDENLNMLLGCFRQDRSKGHGGFPSWKSSQILHQLIKPT